MTAWSGSAALRRPSRSAISGMTRILRFAYRTPRIRGIAELADDIDREFLNWLARTHMGLDEYPRETPEIARMVITIRPERFVMGGVHG